MKMKFLKIAVIAIVATMMSCSSSDNGGGSNDDGGTITDDDGGVVVSPDIVTPENVRSYMVDPNATEETVALFYNLKKLQKEKFLVGQQDAFNAFYNDAGGDSDIKKATGYDPALLGSDFMFITDDQNTEEPSNWFYQQEILITDDVEEAYNKGMVNVLAWHFREPYEGEHFYTSEMTDFQKFNAFPSILPGGENHDYYKEKLDKVAEVLSNIKGANNELVPVIFRPFHEFDGNWFWWGSAYCTPEQYKEAWQFTVEYLRDTKNVHNVIYAYSPDKSYTTATAYLQRYPGDDYIDVLSMDNYGDFDGSSASGVSTANDKLKMVSDLAIGKVKVAALSETGYRVTADNSPISGFFNTNIYNAMTNNNVELAFVMFWSNGGGGYYVPPAGQSNTQDFVDFTQREETVLQNDIPDMYTISK
ncbi:mannan endo-1,4-beta-mannosidase [Flavobacterium suaedae]|uniref:Mannan endo-1,4-beta-mannosidase n=1 Tax=Flavobacterium suaedae TaxID=1767027 RepID=A0ABQ1JSU7_9FLAO|nr:glycosyl hydrolase [Flavobacterium suaedae]GGB76384.1 mannan endo-1,4-beta-mannosidase [Flavobacterium suaedae]